MLPYELSSSGVDVKGKQRSSSSNIITSDSHIALLQTFKSKQIAQLHLVPFRVIELKKDLEYQIIISEVPEFSLFVSIPRLFPQEKVQIRVSEPLNHPWISDGVLVDECPLINDSPDGTNIGRIVKEVADELLVHIMMPMNLQSIALSKTVMKPINPTTQPILSNHSTFHPANTFLMSTASHKMKSSTNPVSGSHYDSSLSSMQSSDSSFLNYGGLKVTSSVQNIDKARITSIQDLDKLSTEEITLTLNDAERLEGLLMGCHGNQVEMFRMRRKEFSKQMEDLAHSNLSKATALEKMKAQLTKTYQEHEELVAKLEHSSKKLEEKLKSTPDSEMMFDSMRIISMDAEEKSDAVAKSFMKGEINVEEFLKAFQEQRKIFHARSIKCHKLNEHLCYGVPL